MAIAPPAPAASEGTNASGPGEFTRMLQTLKAPPGGSAPGAKPAQELASIFKQVSVERPERADTPPPAGKPFAVPVEKAGAAESPAGPAENTGTGEDRAIPTTFTQMFSALSEKPSRPAEMAATSAWTPVTAAPTPPVQPAVQPAVPAPGQPIGQSSAQPSGQSFGAAASEPGEFTRVFQSVQVPGGPAGSVPGNRPALVVPPPEPSIGSESRSSEPGGFTQMFSKPAVPAEAVRRDEPGTFTQMFSKPAAPAAPPAAQETAFPSLRTEPPPAEKDFGWAAGRAAEPPVAAQGGFTQLFRALNQEEAGSAKAPEAPLPPMQVAPQTSAAAGGFTQLLQSLSTPPAQGAPGVDPAAGIPGIPQSRPAAPPAGNFPAANFSGAGTTSPAGGPAPSGPMPSGPGEFTRVISGSAFREAQAGAVGGPASAPLAAPAAGRPSFPMPAAMPPMAAPKAPTPHLAPPAFAFPPPAAPQAGPPPPAAAAPPQSGLQKHLPLILLVNVFLLLVIVLILVFVLRHR
jgi:hypothetical protein